MFTCVICENEWQEDERSPAKKYCARTGEWEIRDVCEKCYDDAMEALQDVTGDAATKAYLLAKGEL